MVAYDLGNTPSIQFNSRTGYSSSNSLLSLTLGINGNALYLVDTDGANIRTNQFSISTNSDSTHGQPTLVGGPVTVGSGSYTTGLAIDPVNRYLILSDGTNLYVRDTANSLAAVGSPAALSQVSDLAIFRVQ